MRTGPNSSLEKAPAAKQLKMMGFIFTNFIIKLISSDKYLGVKYLPLN